MRILIMVIAMLMILSITGCSSTEAIAKGLAAKNTSGDGQVILNKVTVMDPQTGSYTPQIFSLFINGRFMNLLKDANVLNYTRAITPAWYNKENVTISESLIISVQKSGNLPQAIKNMAQVLRQKNIKMTLEGAAAAATEPQVGK